MAPGLVPSPRHPGGCRLLLASLTGSERRGNLMRGTWPRAVAPSSRRMSSPARIPDWEREEGNRSMAPGLVPSPRHPGGCRLRLASLTGSERRGNFVHGARPRAVASPNRILELRQKIPLIPFSVSNCANRADCHSALERVRGPTSPTHRGLARWRHGTAHHSQQGLG